MMMDTLAARLTTGMVAMDDVDNPFDHTTPDVTIFGVDFSNKLYQILGAVWGLAFIYAAYKLIMGAMAIGRAKKVQHNPDALSDASEQFKIAAVAVVVLSALPVIFAVLVNLF